MKVIVRIASLACAALLVACASFAQRPLPPKVAVDTVRAVVGGNGDTRFRITLNVTNPNAYDVAVSTIEAAIRVEGRAIATANLPDPVVLRSLADSKVDIDARPDFNALGKAFDSVLRRLALAYELTGFAVIDTQRAGAGAGAFDGMRVPFSKRGELPLSDFLGRIR